MPSPNKMYIAMGLLTAALGTLPLLSVLGIIPSRPAAPGDAPAWVGGAIGLTFFLGGIAVIVKSLAGALDSSGGLPATSPRALRVFYDVIAMPIPVLLAMLLSWVALGSGERHFSVSGGSGGSAISTIVSGGGQIFGWVAFGFSALLGWVIVGRMIVSTARRWFPRR